ncbi:MAG: dephospho-CoA kinase [Bacteroidales bacterium]|nr:dephospho-CoA kinase [Bacteroidales bacterium]
MMIKVGLTGNIGSGKTLVAEVFSVLGVPVFHADKEAGKLFDQEQVRLKVRGIFGPGVFSPEGEIIKPALAGIVFGNKELLEKLNGIIHPLVRNAYTEWCLQYPGAAYTLYEAAILFESGHYREMDKVICVTAPEELRINRVIQRDHLTRHEVEQRMANQWDEKRKAGLSDFIIRNDETEPVITQVMAIHKQLIKN